MQLLTGFATAAIAADPYTQVYGIDSGGGRLGTLGTRPPTGRERHPQPVHDPRSPTPNAPTTLPDAATSSRTDASPASTSRNPTTTDPTCAGTA